MWRSDGTDPNGALTGTAGDICLNGASNTLTYCTGTTNWTALGAGVGGTARFTQPFPTYDAFTDGKKYTSAFTGTGAISSNAGGWTVSTGTTAGSRSAFYGSWVLDVTPLENVFDDSPEIQAFARLSNNTTDGFISYIMFGNNAGTFPTQATGALTQKHLGFLLDTTVLYATNASGTTQTTTDISSGVTVGGGNVYRAVQSGSTNIKFYVNKSLKATHTTNLPTGSIGIAMMAGIQNDSGVTTNRSLFYGGCNLLWNAE